MSRESWLGHLITSGKSSDWRQVFQHKPLKGRTADPEALEFHEASQLFLQGIKLARRGDLDAGRSQIATAFLLDGRSINFATVLPVGEEKEAGDLALDVVLLYQLMQHKSFGAYVLRILAARYLGSSPEGQTFIGGGLHAIDHLIKAIEQDPKLEGHWRQGGVLGGCMTRTNLLFQRSSLQMAMGNHNKAIKDLTKALEIDPRYTSARDARASLWASMKLRDHTTIHAEYKRIVAEVHEDNRGLEVAYGWLAFTTLQDAKLGTVQDAKRYYEKCVRSTLRRDELYGKRSPNKEPPILQLCKDQFAFYDNGPPQTRKFREDCDVAVLSGNFDDLQIPDGMQLIPQPKSDANSSMRHKCLKCGKMALDTGRYLYKCSRCKKVSYCSRDCQVADYPAHKTFCRLAASKMKMPPSCVADPQQDTPTVVEAKSPISDMDGNARAAARLEDELRKLYHMFGAGFADWWHEMSVVDRTAVLLYMTHNTLPREMPNPQQVQVELGLGIMARSAFDCCVKTVVGSCGCAENPDLRKLHHYPDRLLHELHLRTMNPERAKTADYDICTMMLDTGVFPKLHDRLAIIVPNVSEGPEKHDMQVNVFTDACPEHVEEECRKRISDGEIQEASTAIYMVMRNFNWLQLLVKLFDHYQERVRRCPPEHPLERLRGCEHCHQTCEGQEAVRCETCVVTWWCCKLCRKASSHGSQPCPIGQPSESRVLFKW